MSLSKTNYSVKPLKGLSIRANSGIFGSINGGQLQATSLLIPGFIDDSVISNITLADSTLINCIIGLGTPSEAHFTTISTTQDVTFYGTGLGNSVTWDPLNNEFTITGSFHVNGCSFLGNIEICVNTISATNLNGDINIVPNNLGTLFLKGGVSHNATVGNYSSNIINGMFTQLARDNVTVTSSQQNILLTSAKDQIFSTLNGDIILNTDTTRVTKNITQIDNTNGNLRITSFNSNSRIGDHIILTSSLFTGEFIVDSVVNANQFTLGTTGSFSNITSGSFIKLPDNDITLNASRKVNIPNFIPLVFGISQNNITANSTGGVLLNSINDFTFTSNTQNSLIKIPQTTHLQFGSSSGNYLALTSSGTVSINATADISITSNNLNIHSNNVVIDDPIISLAKSIKVNNIQDKGIEYNWYDSSTNSIKLGWFGYKNNSKLFTFIPDATNNNEIITGSLGNFAISSIQADLVTLTPGGILNINCGSLVNTNLISGCGSSITINATTNTIINSNNINFNSTNVNLNSNSFLNFDTIGNYLTAKTNGNLLIHTPRDILISTGTLILPQSSKITFDNLTNTTSNVNIYGSNGNLIINSTQSIFLNSNNIVLPNNTSLILGSVSNIIGNINGLSFNSKNIINLITTNGNINLSSTEILLNATNIRIPQNKFLVFDTSGVSHYISLDSFGNLNIVGNSFGNLNLTSFQNINIPQNSVVNIGNSSSIFANTSGNLIINNNSGTFITNTSGNLNIINTNTLISTGNFIINGNFTYINTSDLSIRDPIVSIAETGSPLIASDLKDRGIQFNYFTSTPKTGFFGIKDTTNRFVYYQNAINTNNVITGTIGSMEAYDMYIDHNLVFPNSGNIDLNCGSLLNTNTITGCSGILNLNAGVNMRITASNLSINSSNVNINNNCPINFGSSRNSIMSDTSGNLILTNGGNFIINSNVVITGTTSNVFSTITNLQDPIFSLGGVTGPVVDDLKDRGIEFKWNLSGVTKTGFFGYKNNTGRFTFIRDGTNTNEVYSGNYSDVQFGNGFVNNLDLNNGTITNINVVSGNNITISSTNLNLSNKIIQIPTNSQVFLGNSSIINNSNGSLNINNSGGILLNSASFVSIPTGTELFIGNGIIVYNTSSSLVVSNTSGNIDIIPRVSMGSINIPLNTPINFGSSDNSIISDGTQLTLNGYGGISLNSSSVNIAGNVTITGLFSASNVDFDFNTYILALGTIQALGVVSITNSSTTGKLLVTTSGVNYFSSGDSVYIKNTDTIPVIDAVYNISSIVNSTTFTISHTNISTNGTTGVVQSKLMKNQNKEVGIQVNYWSTTGNFSSITSGSINSKTGFFGFDHSSERWVFYNDSLITQSNVLNGTLGNIKINELYSNYISSTSLSGTLNGNTQLITGTNFEINGGVIDNTPIGINIANSGRFTNLSNTVSATLTGLTLNSSMAYSIDRYTLQSGILDFRNPDNTKVMSLFKVIGSNYTTSSGTMGSIGISDGTLKIITCAQMGLNSKYTLFFNNLIAPNPINPLFVATTITFKRQGQNAHLMYDAIDNKWILVSATAYIN
jgi:hypothetical protein